MDNVRFVPPARDDDLPALPPVKALPLGPPSALTWEVDGRAETIAGRRNLRTTPLRTGIAVHPHAGARGHGTHTGAGAEALTIDGPGAAGVIHASPVDRSTGLDDADLTRGAGVGRALAVDPGRARGAAC